MLNTSQHSPISAPPILAFNPAKNPQNLNAQNLNVSSTATKTSADKAAPVKGGAEESQDRFLKLLVTQMKNQDPLNPMDNAQVTSQMAQLSTVSGIDKLNATLAALSSSMAASHSVQAAAMIGHVVMVPGNKMELKDGSALAGLELVEPADHVTVQIKDAAGNEVKSMKLGSQPSGVLQVKWDGMTNDNVARAEGQYQFSAVASLGGKNTNVNTLSYGLVNGVIQKPEGARLSVAQLGEVAMDAVKQIL